MKAVSFFSDEMIIDVYAASDKNHINKQVSIHVFAKQEPVSLYETDNGEYLVRTRIDPITRKARFIQGKEVLK